MKNRTIVVLFRVVIRFKIESPTFIDWPKMATARLLEERVGELVFLSQAFRNRTSSGKTSFVDSWENR